MIYSDEDDFPAKDEDEVSIPRASLNKFIKDVVPDARLTTESRDLLLNCCHAFIHQLATEANIACAVAKRKTISPEHIFQGLDAMKLSSYKEHAVVASEEAKEELKGRRMLSASYRFKHHDSEELERLMKQQQEIFIRARADFVGDQVDRDDLLVASAAAASTGVAATTGLLAEGSRSPVSLDLNPGAGDRSGESQSLAPAVQLLTGSGRLLCAGGVSTTYLPNDSSDDNYDE